MDYGIKAMNTRYILDKIRGAVASYSTRRLKSSATRCMRVRNDLGDELDIGFVGKKLDEATLLVHCDGGDGIVTTWYDQSGLNNHATQTTVDNMPRIVTSGTIDLHGIFFDGVKNVLPIPSTTGLDLKTQGIFNFVIRPQNSNGFIFCLNNTLFTTIQYGLYYNNTFLADTQKSVQLVLDGDRKHLGELNSIPNDETKVYSSVFKLSDQKAYVNNSKIGTDGDYDTELISRNNFQIGARSTAIDGSEHSIFFKGHIQEIIILASQNDNERVLLEQNQLNYFNIT
jgi:hypothetical protein